MGGKRRHGRRSRIGAGAAGAAIAILSLSLASCGDDSSSSSDAKESAGPYRVKVVGAEFPAKQRLGQTSLLQIGVRNSGRETIPALAITVSVAGEQGQASSLPFGIRSPESGLAQPDRPVWVLSEKYPKLVGSDKSAGAENASRKTFLFGPLKAGETSETVWKLTASRTGAFRLLYSVGNGLSGEAKTETAAGGEPGGSIAARITEVAPETIVTDSGEVVEVQPGKETQANR
ncbi:MAG TPA: hypothetical protein VNP96_03430 [Solirubrobacterales bacterium]|nr:hypothetical protein [Solirubrobacterales bacterium]